MQMNVLDPIEYIKWYNRVDKMILTCPEELGRGRVLELDDIVCQIHYVGGGVDILQASDKKFGMWIEIDDTPKNAITFTVIAPGFEKCDFEYRALGETVEDLNKEIEDMSQHLDDAYDIEF